MKRLLCVAFLFFLMGNISGDCDHPVHGKLTVGEHNNLRTHCGVVVCKDNGDVNEQYLCPEILVQQGYKIVSDMSLPYPGCCTKAEKIEEGTSCYHEDYGRVNVGTTKVPNRCGVIRCKPDGTTEVDICPLLSVAPGYTVLEEDLSKPHPECCQKAVKIDSVQKN